MTTCHNNPEKSRTAKINEHTPSVYYCLHIVCLIHEKINLINTEAKIV